MNLINNTGSTHVVSTNFITNNNMSIPVHLFDTKELSSMSVIFAIIFGVILIIGIFTNLLVIGVFILNSEFRHFTNFFFVNLSIADILVLVCCIPITITDLFSPVIILMFNKNAYYNHRLTYRFK